MIKNMKKFEYEDLVVKLKECLDWYDRRFLKRYNQSERDVLDISYNLQLDNGDKLRLEFMPKNIAHLLGIDTVCLKAKGLYKMDSYDILKSICDDSYRLSREVSAGRLMYNDFISDFVDDKVESFKKICGVDLSNIAFVCKYDKEKSYITGQEQLDADYYIAYKGDNKLYVVGFKKDGNSYFPITNRIVYFDNQESMKFLYKLLDNQIITMPTYVYPYYYSVGRSGKTFYLLYENKREKIKLLNDYSKKYNATVDISDGYLYVIEKLVQSFKSNESLMPIYERIFYYINKRLRVDVPSLQKDFGGIPDSIISLIEIYNKSIDVSITEALDKKTREVISERDKFSKENQKHIKELEELKKELLKKQAIIDGLQSQINGYQEREATIKKVLSIDVKK
ncbi:MAG: hypothetical protein IJZ46_02480 [Bacilli bacterium]|nr:hypothetical protein [Bacilli bacterium]